MIFDAIIISDNNSKFTTWLLIGQFNRTIYVCLYVFQYNTCRYELFGYLRNILLIQYHKRKHRIYSMRRHYIQFLLRVHPKIYKNEMDPNLCVFLFSYFNCVFIFCLSINFHKTYTYRIRVSGASPEKAKNHPFMAVRLCCPKYFIVNVLFFNYGWGGLAELSFEQLPNYFGSCLCLLNGIESIRLLFLCNKHSNVNCVCSLVTSQQRIKRKM